MTKELFLKYIEGCCNPQEKIKAEEWLRTCKPEELDSLMLDIWDNKDNPTMPVTEADKLWRTLSATIMKPQPTAKIVGMLTLKKWAVAIAALVILAIGITWVSQKKQTPVIVHQSATLVETPVINWVHVMNTSEKENLVRLEDGSEVWLFPKSTLTYREKPGKDRRDLFLDGKALFQVAKDSTRPFTVYCGDIATTALGTRFLVDGSCHTNSIQVRLYEGKVVVRTGKYPLKNWTRQEFLLPGEELNFNMDNQLAVVKHNRIKEVKVKYETARPAKELVFTNEELYNVFEKIKQQYKVNIKYSKADIKGMYFTGSISQNSALTNSLRVITQMNGLSLKEEHGKYIIQKTE